MQSQTSTQSVKGIKDTDRYPRKRISGKLEVTNVTTSIDAHVRTAEKLITLVIQPILKFSKFILNLRHKDKLGREAGKGGGGQKEGMRALLSHISGLRRQTAEPHGLSPWYCLPMMQWWDREEIVRMSFNSGKVGGRGNAPHSLKKSAYTYRRIWQSSSGGYPQCQGLASGGKTDEEAWVWGKWLFSASLKRLFRGQSWTWAMKTIREH